MSHTTQTSISYQSVRDLKVKILNCPCEPLGRCWW